MNAIVLIGDLIDSRKLENSDRSTTQRDLKRVLAGINRETSDILSPWTITLGDEFQAVYQSAGGLFQHIWTITAALHPVHARICISPGLITTPLNRRQSIGMDGPAFHSARDGINLLKKEESLLRVNLSDPATERALNASLALVSREMESWNSNRFQILQKLGMGHDVNRIASDLGLSDVAVYKNRNAGALDVILDLMSGTADMIDAEITRLNDQTGKKAGKAVSSNPTTQQNPD